MAKHSPLKPPLALLVKLGSIAVHADEMNDYGFDPRTHQFLFDRTELGQLLADPEVRGWLTAMRKEGLVPVKRDGRNPS
jgi:hypothetical protein